MSAEAVIGNDFVSKVVNHLLRRSLDYLDTGAETRAMLGAKVLLRTF